MVTGPCVHDGTNYGGTCNTFYDGDICIKGSSGGSCTPLTRGEALQLALDLLELIRELDEEPTST